jgi:hypothetical protein
LGQAVGTKDHREGFHPGRLFIEGLESEGRGEKRGERREGRGKSKEEGGKAKK